MNLVIKTFRFCSFSVISMIMVGNAQAQVELLTNRDFSAGLTSWTGAASSSDSVAGTCGYNADAAPGTETLTSAAGFTPLTGTQIALGSMSLTAIGFRSCVLYQDIAIPVGATTATFSGDLGIKSVGGLASGDQAIFVGMYSTASVPSFNTSTSLAGTTRLIVGGAATSPNLVTYTSVSWNVSSLAGTTVRLAIINAMQSTSSGTGAFVPGANSVIGANNLSFSVAVTPPVNLAPTASAVTITGSALVGGTLTGTYTYSDTEGNSQGSSTLRWMRGSQIGGSDKAAISGATASTYSPVGADAGNYLFYCVTPVATAGTLTGTEVCSDATKVAFIPDVVLPASVTGVSAGALTPLDMSRGYGPTLTNCLMNDVRAILGADAVYDGQSTNGAVRISRGATNISFYPLQANVSSSQTPNLVLRSSNISDLLTTCGTLGIAPAFFNLTEFGAFLGVSGLSASINAQGVVSFVSGDVTYVVRPDYYVTKGQAGPASVKLGADGFYRFTDSAGYAQVIRPAFADVAGLEVQAQLALGLGGWTTIQTDGTALFVAADARQFVLAPDPFLTAPPAANASALWWKDSPTHFFFRSSILVTGQGFTVQPR